MLIKFSNKKVKAKDFGTFCGRISVHIVKKLGNS